MRPHKLPPHPSIDDRKAAKAAARAPKAHTASELENAIDAIPPAATLLRKLGVLEAKHGRRSAKLLPTMAKVSPGTQLEFYSAGF